MAVRLDVPGLGDLDVEGKRVVVRVDFNVPLDEAEDGSIAIGDDTRIRAALPTIREILERGGTPVLLSHLGRPRGVDDALRLGPVARRLGELLGSPVLELDESVGAAVEARLDAAPAGSVCLLENVRFHPGETKGDPELSAAYARLGQVFVNDAFGSSHRDHASVSGVARLLPAAAGRLLERELVAFRRVLEDPQRPLVAVLGGAKVSDKLPVVTSLLEKVDAILVGGGMAYTFLAARGESVGRSLVEEERIPDVRANMARAEERGCEILLPVDHVVAAKFDREATPELVKKIPADRMGLDVGPETRALYACRIEAAGTVVWNGPMGVFEWPAFREGTAAVGRAVAASTGYTVVGGGDSVAAIQLLGLADRIDHISTGGGASLELLEGRVLPGLEVLGRQGSPG